MMPIHLQLKYCTRLLRSKTQVKPLLTNGGSNCIYGLLSSEL